VGQKLAKRRKAQSRVAEPAVKYAANACEFRFFLGFPHLPAL